MELKNIAIVGAGGNVGKAIIAVLLPTNTFTITAICRPTSTYAPPSPLITRTEADFSSQASLAAALAGQDCVLCCVPGGQTKWGPQKLLIDACVDAGVKLFVASEYVANILSPQYSRFPAEYVGDKIRVREYLEELAAHGRIKWSALNGGPFFDMWLLGGHAGFDIDARKATIYGTGNNLACWTPLPFIATAALRMLQNPAAIANKPVFVAGVAPGVTQNTILEALEAELGDKFAVERRDIKQIRDQGFADVARGDLRTGVRGLALSQQFNEEDSAANFWHLVDNELVGVKPVSVREAVRMTLEMAGKK